MTDLSKATKMISVAKTKEFLKNKFDADKSEVDFWVERLFAMYSARYSTPHEEIREFEEEEIKRFDFRENWPLKVSYDEEQQGNIIPGLEAAAILRDKGFSDADVKSILNSFVTQAFKDNKMLVLNTNSEEDYKNLFYEMASLARELVKAYPHKYSQLHEEVSDFKERNVKGFGFKPERPLKLSPTEGHASIISGVNVAEILRNEWFKGSEIKNFLDSLVTQAFKNIPVKESKTLVLNTNLLEDYENLFYSENLIRNFLPTPELQYISLQDIETREQWERFKKFEIINFLKKHVQKGKLKVYDKNCACPSYTKSVPIGRNGDGTLITETSRIPKSYYGEESQMLIDNGSAMFQLSEILAIEKINFTTKRKNYSSEKYHMSVTQKLYEELSSLISDGTESPIHNRNDLAYKILKMGNDQGYYKKTLSVATIETYINKLGIRKSQWSTLTKANCSYSPR